jgi:hypothetical protein
MTAGASRAADEFTRAFASAPTDGSRDSAEGFSKSNNAVATDALLRDLVFENKREFSSATQRDEVASRAGK